MLHLCSDYVLEISIHAFLFSLFSYQLEFFLSLLSTGTVDTPSLRERIQARPDPEQVLKSEAKTKKWLLENLIHIYVKIWLEFEMRQ